ncbi:MAG: type II CAAX endopeptidase family protein [Longimicrobiales bacterium]|nr:type II CAAX endopeptidase family protein [Longimicrobiales bacterium]
MSLTHDGKGRLRLGWRLLLFLAVAQGVAMATGALLPFPGLWSAAAGLLAGALSAGWVVLRLDGRGPGALGFHLARSVPREVGLGWVLGLALAGVVLVLVTLTGGVRWGAEAGTLGQWLEGAGRAAAFLAVAAAAEEALLRGYPLQALAEAWGAGWALGVTSVAFAAMHLGNPGATALGAAGTAAAGLALGAIYLRTGSLWWATGAHLGWNWGVAYVADLPLSGMEVADAPWVRASPVGPEWVGGGAFGPEGSSLAALAFLAAAALCWWGPWLSVEPAARARRPLAVVQREEHAP